MNKLLCIVGPTGTGKTALAVKKSQEQPSILVSADSRQVYRGMDIVTGKDHPAGVTIYGIDIIDHGENCSVAVWYDAVMPHIFQAWEEGKQVIVVGGTGLYVRALTHGIDTMKVPINQPLRDELSVLSMTELQSELTQLAPTKFASMNHSDQNNPRRLIRAIEVARFLRSGRNDGDLSSRASREISQETEIIGLRYFATSKYRSAIEKRVEARLSAGAVKETNRLMTIASPQSMTAIGYRSLVLYIQGDLSYDEMKKEWINDELAYARRQLTWFAKVPQIKWYDIE